MTSPRPPLLPLLCLLAASLAGCRATDAPTPKSEVATGAIDTVPAGIKPLTVEQEEMVNSLPH